MAGHNYLALKVLLPLVVTEPQIGRAVAGVKALLDTMKREKVAFWVRARRSVPSCSAPEAPGAPRDHALAAGQKLSV
jgi:hypothetical protein